MDPFWLHLRAPFAAFRPLQAGSYRTTAPVLPPSSALGVVLNLAGIEMRDPTPQASTGIRSDVPRLQLSIGLVRPASVATLYQQLHQYPVGSSGKELQALTHGAKYWIAPVRRELLVDLDSIVGVRSGDRTLRERVERGLRGESGEGRYGLPFAGDNSFLFDRIELLSEPLAARWYVRLGPEEPPAKGTCRLTIGIDRQEASRTTTGLFAPLPAPCEQPPEAAWTWTPSAPESP